MCCSVDAVPPHTSCLGLTHLLRISLPFLSWPCFLLSCLFPFKHLLLIHSPVFSQPLLLGTAPVLLGGWVTEMLTVFLLPVTLIICSPVDINYPESTEKGVGGRQGASAPRLGQKEAGHRQGPDYQSCGWGLEEWTAALREVVKDVQHRGLVCLLFPAH